MRLAHPKPEKRAPRPRKRIDRGSAPKRKTPVRKRSANRVRTIRADADWSQTVRWRDGWCRLQEHLGCEWMATDAHHVKGKKAHPKLRHELDNGIGLCRQAHDWAHANRDEFKAWYSDRYAIRWARLQELVKAA